MSSDAEAGPACIEAGILENALVMIVVMEKSGKILAWNHAAETITGHPKDTVIGKATVWKALYPQKEYRDSVTQRIGDILKTKNYFENFETTVTPLSGPDRIILWNAKEITAHGMNVVVTVGQDITRLRELDAFRTSIVENANVLITVMDPKGTVLVWNTAAEEITGYNASEVVGRSAVWKNLYPDSEYREKVTSRITGIISEHKYFENLETRITTKSGDQRVISWNTRQIDGDEIPHIITIGRDITEQKKAEEALIAYMTEMAMRIKQPVTIIRDNLLDIARLVREGKLSPDEIAMLLDAQIRNATQVGANVQEFQKAVLEKNPEIPEAYRAFLEG